MADAAVEFLLENLKTLMVGDEDIISKVENELKKLMDDVRLVKADADRILQAEQLRETDLVRLMKEIVYDVEDVVESSSVQMAAAEGRFVCFRLPRMRKLGESLVREIESIRSDRLEPITRKIKAYKDLGIEQTHSTQTNLQVPSKQQKKEDPAIRAKKLVGLKDEAETLISSLLEETGELDFIAITGMAGIGKTTLASKIYHDSRIQREFPTRIWVWVDDDFGRKELCLDILKQGMIGYPESDTAQGSSSSIQILNKPSDDQLMEDVRDFLERSKYLLVIDDVWDAKSLNEVTAMLPKMGKVLITSRNNHITTKVRTTKPPHVLRFLHEEESWELLQLEVFGKLNACPPMLKDIGGSIARNCGGLPLAISVVGSSLVASSNKDAEDLTMEWWKAVSQNLRMYITDYRIGHNVIKIVELSYTTLPQYLQACFLYLGVFPEGHEIHVRKLVRLWIAEGLVHDNIVGLWIAEGLVRDNKPLEEQIWGETEEIEMQIPEEIAHQYLHDLIDRNLVMVARSYSNGQIKTCRMHKLIYAFCKYKAAELDLYQEIKMSGNRPLSLVPDCHRLCIYSPLSQFLSRSPKEQRVRSFLYFNKDRVLLDSNHSSVILECFKLLRVLKCIDANFSRFPDKLSKLIHLRYISLSCDEIHVIPETISLLRHLETLVVNTKSSSLRLTANLWKMVQLRHFVTKAAIILAIQGDGGAGKNLQTLTRLAPACCTEDVFTRAPNLKTLGIRGNLDHLSDANSLRKLKLLQHLKLISELPAANKQLLCLIGPSCFPPTLKRLTLSGTHLGWENMSILGKIEGLEILKLKNNAFVGDSWITNADDFGRLRFLLIATTDLKLWEASPDCFPSLKGLVLKKCEKLQEVPPNLAKSHVRWV